MQQVFRNANFDDAGCELCMVEYARSLYMSLFRRVHCTTPFDRTNMGWPSSGTTLLRFPNIFSAHSIVYFLLIIHYCVHTARSRDYELYEVAICDSIAWEFYRTKHTCHHNRAAQCSKHVRCKPQRKIEYPEYQKNSEWNERLQKTKPLTVILWSTIVLLCISSRSCFFFICVSVACANCECANCT